MLNKLFRIQIGTYVFCVLFSFAQPSTLTVYSPQEMQEHKNRCKEKITSTFANYHDASYQMKRALLTISANDTDSIPKIIGAGEIFQDETGSYQLMHNGIKIVLNCYYDVQWLTDVMYALKGHHEPQEEKCFYEVLKYIPDNATMIELGSFWAYYSLWFASEIKNPTNYMIEPDLQRLEVGKKNFVLNNKTGIFKRGYFGKMHDTGVQMAGAEQMSIDDFMDKEGITHLHILHSDIQAAEYEMLKTSINHLNNIDYFFISTHSDDIHRQCLNFFRTHKFHIIADHLVSESCSADGLIVARREGVVGPDHIEIGKYRP